MLISLVKLVSPVSLFLISFSSFANPAAFDFDGSLMPANVDFSQVVTYADSATCASDFNTTMTKVKTRKFFPLYKKNDMGGMFEYEKRFFVINAKCHQNNMLIKIKETI